MTPFRGIGANTALRDAMALRRALVAVSRGEADLIKALADLGCGDRYGSWINDVSSLQRQPSLVWLYCTTPTWPSARRLRCREPRRIIGGDRSARRHGGEARGWAGSASPREYALHLFRGSREKSAGMGHGSPTNRRDVAPSQGLGHAKRIERLEHTRAHGSPNWPLVDIARATHDFEAVETPEAKRLIAITCVSIPPGLADSAGAVTE